MGPEGHVWGSPAARKQTPPEGLPQDVAASARPAGITVTEGAAGSPGEAGAVSGAPSRMLRPIPPRVHVSPAPRGGGPFAAGLPRSRGVQVCTLLCELYQATR